MINSTFNPTTTAEFDKTKIATNDQSASGLCLAGQSVNIDLTMTDDHLLTGLKVLAKGSNFGDTLTLQIVDVVGTLPNGMSFPPNTILNQFGTSLPVGDDEEEKFNEESEYPAKILAGMTIRCIYSSTGTSNVQVASLYKLHKVLV